jgi:hypothetical protein
MKVFEIFQDEPEEFNYDQACQVLFQKMEQMRLRLRNMIKQRWVALYDEESKKVPQEDIIPYGMKETGLGRPHYRLLTKSPTERAEALRIFKRFYKLRTEWLELKESD